MEDEYDDIVLFFNTALMRKVSKAKTTVWSIVWRAWFQDLVLTYVQDNAISRMFDLDFECHAVSKEETL